MNRLFVEPLSIFLIKETFQSDEENVDPDETVFNDEEKDLLMDEPRNDFPFTEKSDFLDFIDEDTFLNNPMVSGFSDAEDEDGCGEIFILLQ